MELKVTSSIEEISIRLVACFPNRYCQLSSQRNKKWCNNNHPTKRVFFCGFLFDQKKCALRKTDLEIHVICPDSIPENKRMSNERIVFRPSLFRGHVSFGRCIFNQMVYMVVRHLLYFELILTPKLKRSFCEHAVQACTLCNSGTRHPQWRQGRCVSQWQVPMVASDGVGMYPPWN